jgi:hypothetical protein
MCTTLKLSNKSTQQWDPVPGVPVSGTGDNKYVMLDFLKDLAAKLPDIGLTFHMHYYPVSSNYISSEVTDFTHNPQLLVPLPTNSIFDEDKNVDWPIRYMEMFYPPAPGWELGVANKVIYNKKVQFIPMFDMKGTFYNQREQLRRAFGPLFVELGLDKDAQVFFSGKSYHVYSPRLVDAETWKSLLIDSLLKTDLTEGFGVDTRWVGNALREGFTAIRVTNFTLNKPVIPYRVYDAKTDTVYFKPFEPENDGLPF